MESRDACVKAHSRKGRAASLADNLLDWQVAPRRAMRPAVVPYVQTAVLPPEQEAAVMFASGRTEDARWILEGLVRERDTQDDPRSWALLFTLYRVEGDWPK